ncbi:MAG: hypothetical protein AAF135_21155, partial [Bacteroidota bacterium]
EEPVTIVATGNTGGGGSSVWINLGPVLQYDPLYGGTIPTWGTNGDPISGSGSTGNNWTGRTTSSSCISSCNNGYRLFKVLRLR